MAPQTRIPLRHAAVVAVMGVSLLAPTTAAGQLKPLSACTSATAPAAPTDQAAKGKRAPKVSRVKPMKLAVGAKLEIRGKDFVRGRCKNTVVFQRKGGKAVFVRAELATKKLLQVTVPDRLEKQLLLRRGFSVPTRFRVRVLSARFGQRFTKDARSPVIGPKPPPAPPAAPAPVPVPDVDTDGDGRLNSVDADDDNDLLSDVEELAINAQLGPGLALYLSTLNADSDGDEVGDGYELRSARDLNSTQFLPYPGKRLYANPLDGADGNTDFDGDGLTLKSEQRLWRYESARVGRAPSLDELSYSDGTKYSVFVRDGAGRRVPGLPAAGYEREADFRAWASATGYGTVNLPGDTGPRPLLDVNRDGQVSAGPVGGQPYAEASYYDTDFNRVLDDGERDEDADGLSNVDESDGQGVLRRMSPEFWAGRYTESPFPIAVRGTRSDDPDTDGDSIRDGADDQDNDDVPNIMELSRSMAIGDSDAQDAEETDIPAGRPGFGRVNPFNPCLPDTGSRTCPRYVPSDGYAPFDDSPDYFAFE